MDYLFLLGGFAILLISGELLVRGATAIALRFHISTLVVGMTIVSFGTSAPELFISIKAALSGHPDISIGNVVGSNIANIALVLAITCIIFPMPVSNNTIRINWPVMMGASIVFYIFIINKTLELWEGLIFIVVLISFVVWLIKRDNHSPPTRLRAQKRYGAQARAEAALAGEGPTLSQPSTPPKADPTLTEGGAGRAVLFIVLGCIGLAYGADWLVKGAVSIAKNFGISERIIALTIVAFGTSVPELTTSIIAALKKQIDISIGNLIGSNVFNILGILGVTTIFKEIQINERTLNFDIFWMLGIAAFIFPFMLLKKRLGRLEGIILLLAYIVYIVMICKDIG